MLDFLHGGLKRVRTAGARLYNPEITDRMFGEYHLLDANTTRNEDHIFNIIDIDSSGRPDKASANSDVQLLA